MVAKAIRSNRVDDEGYLENFKKKEIAKILNNDQLCFIEPPSNNSYQEHLRKIQIASNQGIIDKINTKYGLNLVLFKTIFDEQEKTDISKIKEMVNSLDYLSRNSLY